MINDSTSSVKYHGPPRRALTVEDATNDNRDEGIHEDERRLGRGEGTDLKGRLHDEKGTESEYREGVQLPGAKEWSPSRDELVGH